MSAGILVTAQSLKNIAPTLSLEKAMIISDHINFICPGYGINSKDILEEFLATIIHESGGFRIKSENLNYRKPQLLLNNRPDHFTSLEFAKQYCGNPQKLAYYIYGTTSISKTLGNIKPEDGYTFRGAGFIQLTGRTAATLYSKYVGQDTPESAMELIRNQDWWAIDSACWVFAIYKNLINAAVNDDFVNITKRINGGLIGWKDRQNTLSRVKRYL